MPHSKPPVSPDAPAADAWNIPGPIHVAQMRRDRDRLLGAEAEIVALRERIEQLMHLPQHRAYEKARRGARHAYHALPPSLQEVIRRLRRRGVAPVGATAAVSSKVALPAATQSAATSLQAGTRGMALIIDDHWPQPNRDSGSVDIVNLAQALDGLGFHVTLAAALEHRQDAPARDALVKAGIRCLLPTDAASVEEYLARQGSSIDLCVLCRVYCGGRFLEATLHDARHARIVFNSIDLNFLREERKALLMQDAAALAIAQQVRMREETIIRSSDATIVVSRTELDFLAVEVPEALVVEMPLARPLVPPVTRFAGRAGIGFIGGFAHAPNVDAVRHFLLETWPLVLRDLPDLELTIVGADFPGGLLEGVPGRVRALGHLPDIAPWLEGLRLTVAPLRFGAGAKGKVASSLAAGVPCIATPVAAEGMLLSEAAGVLVATDPAEFAARLCEAYTDQGLWNRLSAGGLSHAKAHLSLDGWGKRLEGLLQRLGL